jgi:hypothetical protein
MVESRGDWSPGDDDDPRPRPSSLADLMPPVRWPLALIGGLVSGAGAAWEWRLRGPTGLAIVGTVVAAVWVVFAVVRLALRHYAAAKPVAATDRRDG